MNADTKKAIISRIKEPPFNYSRVKFLHRAHNNPDRVSIAIIEDGYGTHKVNITLDYIGINTLMFDKVELNGVI